jgi:Ca2+-binding RTX toxin-like protein
LADGIALPTWLNFNNGTFSGTPGTNDTGSLSVKVTASDGIETTFSTFTLTVAVPAQPPTSANNTVNTDEDTARVLTTADFPFTPGNHGNLQSVTIVQTVAGLTLNNAAVTNGQSISLADINANKLQYKPALDANGTALATFDFQVSDGTTNSSTHTLTIDVAAVNDAPTLASSIADQVTTAGTSLSFTLPDGTFSDVDAGDVLTLSATLADGSVLPTWLSFDATTRSFRANPTASHVGAIDLQVTATDQANATVSDIFNFTVQQSSSDTPLGETGVAALQIVFNRQQSGVVLIGTAGADKMKGTSKINILKGANGNDILNGGFAKQLLGQNKLYGGRGNDRLYGNRGQDLLDGGDGNDRLDGGRGRDLMLGGKGNDRLVGGAGDDILVGGAGKDTLVGSSGKDMFVFNALNEGVDQIRAFEVGQDLVDLRSLMARAEFSGTSSFDQYQKYVQLVQVGANSEVRVDADGSGQGKDFVTLASLQNLSTSSLSSTSFVI